MIEFTIPVIFKCVNRSEIKYVDIPVCCTTKELEIITHLIGKYFNAENIEYSAVTLKEQFESLQTFIKNKIYENENIALNNFVAKQQNMFNFKQLIDGCLKQICVKFAYLQPEFKKIMQFGDENNDEPNIEIIVNQCQKCSKFVKTMKNKQIQRISCDHCRIKYIQDTFDHMMLSVIEGSNNILDACYALIVGIYVLLHDPSANTNDIDNVTRQIIIHWLGMCLKNVFTDVTTRKYWTHPKITFLRNRFANEPTTPRQILCLSTMFTIAINHNSGILKTNKQIITSLLNKKIRTDKFTLLFWTLTLRCMIDGIIKRHKLDTLDAKQIEIYNYFLNSPKCTNEDAHNLTEKSLRFGEFLDSEANDNYLIQERKITQWLNENDLTKDLTRIGLF